jgi:hypothetical protein
MPVLTSLFRFLSLGMAVILPALPAAAKAPFRVIYNNDTVNVTECTSPWHAKGEPFREEMLKASIDEAVDAGVDAYFLQPGLTAVPFWKSAIYPPAEHFRWWQETFQGKLHEFGTYLLEGGDVVAVFVEHCRSRHVAPFISLRVNDYHMVEYLDAPAGTKLPPFASLGLDRFRRERPDLRIAATAQDDSDGFKTRDLRVLDWRKPEVRARLLGFIKEVCAYDIDGLELDFLRHFRLFPPAGTTREERVGIVTGFGELGVRQPILTSAAISNRRRPCHARWLGSSRGRNRSTQTRASRKGERATSQPLSLLCSVADGEDAG